MGFRHKLPVALRIWYFWAIPLYKNPVIADIVSQKSATIPVAGTINNVNWLLGTDGINGIKTGNTDQAGGCFLFSAKHTIDGHDITLIGAIVSAPDLMASVNDSKPLIAAIDKGFFNRNSS